MRLPVSSSLSVDDTVQQRVTEVVERTPPPLLSLRQALELRTLVTAATVRLAPVESPYRELADEAVEAHYAQAIGGPTMCYRIVEPLRGILAALREAYEKGYMTTLEELLHVGLFSDFLSMAQHLLDEGCKDPAAILVGGVLEEHLRKLATKHSVKIDDKRGTAGIGAINDDLYREKAYSLVNHKNVPAGRRIETAQLTPAGTGTTQVKWTSSCEESRSL